MLLQRGDVAPTGSARRRAPPSAEPASCATGCAGKQRLGGPGPDAVKRGRNSGVSSAATDLPGRERREGERIAIEEERVSRPDVKAARCRGEDEECDVRLNSRETAPSSDKDVIEGQKLNLTTFVCQRLDRLSL